MATARQRAEWDRTAMLLCLAANANRDPNRKPRPFAVEDFHPYAVAAKPIPGTIQDFKIFLKK